MIQWLKNAFSKKKQTSNKTNSHINEKKQAEIDAFRRKISGAKARTPKKSPPPRPATKKPEAKKTVQRPSESPNRDVANKKPEALKTKEADRIDVGPSFADLGLGEEILKVLNEKKFSKSTLIQAKAIPHILNNRNILASAATGSGKTLAFSLPMLHFLKTGKVSQTLILNPTREIAIQTYGVIKPFLDALDVKSALVIGGEDMRLQKQKLQEYPPVLVATPGRLLDMINTGLIWLEYTKYVVLDEADRMLDMGFEEDLTRICNELPESVQTLLFSATLDKAVKSVANKYASDYEEIVIGSRMEIANTIEHSLVHCHPKDKDGLLLKVLKTADRKAVVFFPTIREVVEKTSNFKKKGFRQLNCLHSQKSQEERRRVIDGFRNGRIQILFATDVAARGIDVGDIELVVNFELPRMPEDYVHRIGRTGRAGKQGEALSFVTQRDEKRLQLIEKLIKRKIVDNKQFNSASKSDRSDGNTSRHRPSQNSPGRGANKTR